MYQKKYVKESNEYRIQTQNPFYDYPKMNVLNIHVLNSPKQFGKRILQKGQHWIFSNPFKIS